MALRLSGFKIFETFINSIFLFLILESAKMSLVLPEKFQHILRIMSTNIDGKRKVPIAMTAIKGVGRRYSNVVLRKADVDIEKRAGECTEEEVRFNKCHKNKNLINKIILILGRKDRYNHFQSTSIQNPRLVLEQTKGHY